MKKIFFYILILCLFINLNLYGNVATDYNFTQNIGTYIPITGDTVAMSTSTTTDPFQLNDVTYGPFVLPFTFVFDCNDRDSIYINSNGFITFGVVQPGISNYTPISGNEGYRGAISAFGHNLIAVFGTFANTNGTNVLSGVTNFQGVVAGRNITGVGIPAATVITSFNETAGTITMSNVTSGAPVIGLVVQIASGSIVTKTEGLIGSRVYTVQFSNFRHYILEGTDDNLDFQIKLHETTGEINIVYGNMDKNIAPVAQIDAEVGLRGSINTDFANRTNTASLNWAASTAGSVNASISSLSSTLFPASGQTYTWFPNSNCVLPVEMSSFVSTINGRNVTLYWTTASEINNLGFDVERSLFNGQWAKIGFVNGHGTTQTPKTYTYNDRNLYSGLYNYRLKQIDLNGNVSFHGLTNQVSIGIPEKFELSQNYPNPFNPGTRINYSLPYDGKVNLKVLDISGREIKSLVDEFQVAGYYDVKFDGGNLSSGIYFYTLTTSNGYVLTRKMLLVK